MELSERIRSVLNQLARFSLEPAGEGVTRLPFTPQADRAVAFLGDYFAEIGLEVSVDPTGAVWGCLPGETGKTYLYGSHYDSVRRGGRYDGIAGIVCAAEALRSLLAEGKRPKAGIALVATNDEEGVRFTQGFLTSRAICEGLTRKQLDHIIEREEERSLSEILLSRGMDPDQIPPLAGKIREFAGFTEVHIEQGPVLDRAGVPLGLVTEIAGFERYLCRIVGEANHAGSTPMNARKDAFVSAARMIQYTYEQALAEEELVATVGSAQVLPNEVNIIPGRVDFTLEVRSGDDLRTEAFAEKLFARFAQMAEADGVTFGHRRMTKTEAVRMDEGMRESLRKAAAAQGVTLPEVLSGSGHDAQVIGRHIPAAMLFVRSIGGISHSPEERSDEEDLALASLVLKEQMMQWR